MGFQGLTGFGGGATGLSQYVLAGPTVSSSGGTQITSGSDTYHVFLHTGSPQTFTVSDAPGSTTAKLLVIGGGGTGGFTQDGVSGGGGAGGVQYYTSWPITDGSTTVVVGNYGPSSNSASDIKGNPGINNGENTTFGSAIGYGGGGGAHEFVGPPALRQEPGHNGGSSGGGSAYHFPGTPGGTATQPTAPLVSGAGGTNYGNTGGTGGNSNPENPGGGGGGAGGNGEGGNPGNGGPGVAFPEFPGPVLSPAIPATNVTTIGPTGLFAGGGAGGNGSSPVWGPSPGGGAATKGSPGTPIPSATGYGSGGAGTQLGASNTVASPIGTAGIVIIKL